MPNTKYILEQIKIEGELKELLFKAQSVIVTYNGAETTLAAALEGICGDIANMPTAEAMNTAISTAISKSGHARFEKAEAVPAADAAEANVMYLVMNAKTKHYDIYAKVGDEVVLLDDTTVDLSGKVDKVTGATEGAIPALTAEGGIADSGKKVGGAALSENPDADTVATEAAVAAAVEGKVDKVDGKGLSTNDFTTEEKERLAALRGVRCGDSVPDDMQDGELFIRVVGTTAQG